MTSRSFSQIKNSAELQNNKLKSSIIFPKNQHSKTIEGSYLVWKIGRFCSKCGLQMLHGSHCQEERRSGGIPYLLLVFPRNPHKSDFIFTLLALHLMGSLTLNLLKGLFSFPYLS